MKFEMGFCWGSVLLSLESFKLFVGGLGERNRGFFLFLSFVGRAIDQRKAAVVTSPLFVFLMDGLLV